MFHRGSARGAERALVGADEHRALVREWGVAALALPAHLKSHRASRWFRVVSRLVVGQHGLHGVGLDIADEYGLAAPDFD